MAIYSDVSLLHPKFRGKLVTLHEDLIRAYETGITKTRFEIFETFRDPIRQMEMVRKGTSKAAAFHSAHAFGLAADVVPFLSDEEATALALKKGERVWPGWSWDASHDYGFLALRAAHFGLTVPLKWDLCHVEHPDWPRVRGSFNLLQ